MAVGDFANAQVAVLGIAKEKQHIKPFLGHIQLAVGQTQANIHKRVLRPKIRQRGRDDPLTQSERCGDIERTAQSACRGANVGFGHIDGLNDAAGPFVKHPPLFSRSELAGRALKEPCVKVFF